MRVLALTFGDAHLASSKYRIYQYVEPLRALGIELQPTLATDFSNWGTIPGYDAVIVQKKLFAVGKVRRLRKLARRLIYDVDDAIWHPHGKAHSWLTNLRTRMRLRAITQSTDQVLVANGVLRERLAPYNSNVQIAPMALDEAVWKWRGKQGSERPLCIGWAGHPVNLPYLAAIEPALVAVQERHPEVEFHILCGEAPNLRQLRFRHVPFAPATEAEAIRQFDIGLLPLPKGAFAEGKSPIKGLQYMASGAATVLTPVGATREMFAAAETGVFANTLDEWESAIGNLVADPTRIEAMGKSAREAFEARYTLQGNVKRLAALLSGR